MRLANFQLKAIADLMEAMSGPEQEVVLKSCTGSRSEEHTSELQSQR